MRILFTMHPNEALTYDTQEFISYFVKENFDVYFLSSFIGHEGVDRDILPKRDNFRVLTFPNFYVRALDGFLTFKILRNLLVQTAMLLKTAYVTKKHDIDLFITDGGFVESGFAPLVCSKIFRRPLIVRVLGGPSMDVFIRVKSSIIYKIYKRLEIEILKNTSKILVLDKVDEKYKDETLVIPQKVDTQIFKSIDAKGEREKYGLSSSDVILLFVGRITKEKGVKTLVDSFPKVLEKIPNARLLLCGTGNLEGYVNGFIQTHSFRKKIQLLGRKTHEELSILYNLADATILLSEIEGTPNVILESLACNTPVIATKVGNIQDIIKDGKNGFLIEPNPEEIAEAVAKIQELKGDFSRIVKERNRKHERGIKTLAEEILTFK